jgi:pyruvate kinase
MRINCAHDDAATWAAMIDNLRRAERALGQPCKVVMDLGGPKLRTGPLEPGPAVARVRPTRDACGHVTAPARVWLTRQGSPCAAPTDADASLPVSDAWLATLRSGERIDFVDARGALRSLLVVDVTPDGCWTETQKTAYFVPGTALTRAVDAALEKETEAVVGELPARGSSLELRAGDALTITRNLTPGKPATHDSNRRVLTPARIGCTLPEVFDHARVGEPIWFDDGKIGAVIDKVERDRVLVRITQTRADGAKLQADKGINLPETDIRLAAMTVQDIADLPFVANHADIVALSFANTARDVEQLQSELRRFSERPPAIVIKIETRRGFENLPEMLMTAMRWHSCGVMIARGDLAVECGFERLAEVQEEILWICEAGHVPVIWATQVLETLAKRGMASRAEITDAAMGHRAECVMLNKGPHVGQAVRVLDDILRRMQAHQVKKRAMLRRLRLARTAPADAT